MLLNKESIIKICQNYLPIFKNVIKDINYEIKGIINSEMLLFVSLVKYFKVNLILGSGRANGQSNEFFILIILDQKPYNKSTDQKT